MVAIDGWIFNIVFGLVSGIIIGLLWYMIGRFMKRLILIRQEFDFIKSDFDVFESAVLLASVMSEKYRQCPQHEDIGFRLARFEQAIKNADKASKRYRGTIG